MILVVGGAFQGKTEFVKNKWSISDDEIYNKDFIDEKGESIKGYRVLNGFHRIMKNYTDDAEKIADIIINSGIEIIISDEIGCCVVPIDKEQRFYTERTGRMLCRIAGQCGEVYRVYCSIGQRIKGI